jgi:hypothetical protein
VDDPCRPHHSYATYAYVRGAQRCDHHAGLSRPVISAITITGIGDHLRPEWLITFTGMNEGSARSRVMGTADRALQECGIAQKPD